MAQMLLPLAGALLAPTGYASVGWAVGSLAASLLFPQKLPGQEGPRVSDLKVQSSAEGVGLAEVWGTLRMAGNIIGASDLREVRTTEEVGGKGGPTQEVTTYTYYGTWAVGLCEGPIAGIRRIWADHQLIYDSNAGYVHPTWAGKIAIYLGSETQNADPALQTLHGAANTPAYRGLAYLVLDDVLLGDYGNRIPNITAEVVNGQLSATVDTTDAYPYTPIGNSAYNTSSNVMYTMASEGYLMRTNLDGTQQAALALGTTGVGSLGVWSPLDGEHNEHGIWYDNANGALYAICNSNTPVAPKLLKINVSTGAIDAVIDLPGANSAYGALTAHGDTLYVGFCTWSIDPYPANTPHSHTYVATLPLTGTQTLTVRGDIHVEAERFAMTLAYDAGTGVLLLTRAAAYSADLHGYDTATWTVAWSDTSLAFAVRHAAADGDGQFWLTSGDTYAHRVAAATGTRTQFGPLEHALYGLCPSAEHGGAFVVGLSSLDGSTDMLMLRADGVSLPIVELPPIAGVHTGRDFSPHIAGPDTVRHALGTLTIAGIDILLATLLQELSMRGGLTADDIDIRDVDSVRVLGYVRPDVMPPRDALTPLLAAYFVDSVESGGVIRYRSRGAAPALAIDHSDTLADESDAPAFSTVVAQEYELPREVVVRFTDVANDYDAGIGRATRQLTASQSVQQAEMALALDTPAATNIADVMLSAAWAQGRRTSFSLPYSYLAAEPGDGVTLTLPSGKQLTALITRAEYDYGTGAVACEAVGYEPGLYQQVAATDGYFAATPPAPFTLDSLIFEAPGMLDADLNSPYLYATASPATGTWRGATVYKSTDGTTYAAVATVPGPSAMGTAVDALPAPTTTAAIDTAYTLTVDVGDGLLYSTTEAALEDGANAAMLGDEVIQWLDAELNVDGTYTLSNLLRARLGTEHAASSHAIGDDFRVLTTSLCRIPVQTTEMGKTRYYRVVPVGGVLADAPTTTIVPSGENLRPLSPTTVAATRNAGLDIAVTWTRRTRVGGSALPGVPLPLNEAYERYEIDVLDGLGAVVRTLTSDTTAVTYTAADQITDFGVEQASVAIQVYQLSAAVGRGHAADATV